MTPEEYWDGDVWLVRYYREAEKLRQKRDNVLAWLQGMYVYDAIGRMAPVLHAFAKKGTKPQPYPTRPLGEEEKPRLSPEQIVENERLRARLYFENWARSAQKKFKA